MQFKKSYRNPWAWVPTLYYAQGIPYVVVMLVSVIFYKRMGVSNTDIALYTSWLYLPWVLKPFWSPFVDYFKTKRFWIVFMQLFVGAGLAGVAFTIPGPSFLQYTLAFFFLLAFSSATHDIAADGFYMLGLDQHQQVFYVGIRSTFYRIAMITGQGLLIILAGYFETHSGLKSPEIYVSSMPGKPLENISFIENTFSEQDSVLRIVTTNDKIQISTTKRSKYEVDSILYLVKKYNSDNGFYSAEMKKTVPAKFEGNEKDKEKFVGNIALVHFFLSANLPPDKNEIVAIFDRDGGDKSISLIEGTRFIFTKDNWNKPAYALIQLDPKLNFKTEATFKPIAGDIPWAWATTFWLLTGLFVVFFIYHFLVLPYPKNDGPVRKEGSNLFKEFIRTFILFFKKKQIVVAILFLLIYRFGEAQLVKLASPFLLDPREVGGIGLTTGQIGLVYGTIGVIFLTLGGIVGGIVASKDGLKKWLWPMFLSINVPHLLYVYLAYAQPENLFIINLCVAGEQFGYGFGFTAYMLYMIYISEGEFKTSHYAFCTGFMALSMMLPGMISGWIQEMLGYKLFFVWVVLTMIPGFFIVKALKIDPEFGKKKKED